MGRLDAVAQEEDFAWPDVDATLAFKLRCKAAVHAVRVCAKRSGVRVRAGCARVALLCTRVGDRPARAAVAHADHDAGPAVDRAPLASRMGLGTGRGYLQVPQYTLLQQQGV
jgi:hypothetical protein